MLTRSFSRGMRKTESASRSRIACAPAAEAVRCMRPLAASNSPSAPRVSSGAATTRLLTSSHSTTWAAPRIAASTGPISPRLNSNAMLFGLRPDRRGSRQNGIRHRDDRRAAAHSRRRQLRRRRARFRRFPRPRRRRARRHSERCRAPARGRAGRRAAWPSGYWSPHKATDRYRRQPVPPGEHARTPGIRRAASTWIATMRACACGERTTMPCSAFGAARSAI